MQVIILFSSHVSETYQIVHYARKYITNNHRYSNCYAQKKQKQNLTFSSQKIFSPKNIFKDKKQVP